MSEHPADVDLVAFADGELDEVTTRAIRGHVDGCSRCARLLESLLQPLEMDMTSTPAVRSVDLSTMFQRRPDEDPDVGEVWRAEWDTAGLIVLVTGRSDGAYTAVPVTFEEPPDPVSYEIPASASPVGVALHAWPTVVGELPLGVFLTPVGALPSTYVGLPARAMPFGAVTALLLAELIADITALAAGPGFEAGGDSTATISLQELLRGHLTSAINQVTGIPLEIITRYKRAERTPTPEEADRLAAFLGVPATSVTVPVELPTPLLRAVQRPVHRRRIRSLATEWAVTEAVMRTRVAENVLPMAARTTAGERDVAAWDELVSQYLHE